MTKKLVLLLAVFSCSAMSLANSNLTKEGLLAGREERLLEVIDLLLTLDERHFRSRWPISDDQEPNPNYSGGFETTRERFIDNKDRFDLEHSYLSEALNDSFYFSAAFIDYLEELESLDLRGLRQERRKERWSRFRHCNQGRLRLSAQSTIDAIPLLSGLQAELLDKLKDRNSHSPASGFSGILGGIIGSALESARHWQKIDGSYADRLLEYTQQGVEDEYDGGLWAVTRIVWSESFGVNSPCFIARRKLEALEVEFSKRE